MQMVSAPGNDAWVPRVETHAGTPRSAHRKALLIINTKSGRNHDSLLYIRELVQLLQQRGIGVDVRVKLSKMQAQREARAAARRGCELVVAAGGDGTVEAVARGLVDSHTALGIIALGTYNNVATSLGVPAQCDKAVALIAAGVTRAVDVGQVKVDGQRKPHLFLEFATVGLGAAMMPIGQDLEKHRWRAAIQQLPRLVTQAPASVAVQVDEAPVQRLETMLLTISNAPRSGAGMLLAPDARMDDGLLDFHTYPVAHDLRALSIRIGSDRRLAVAADSRIVGTTPARFRVRRGALLVIAGASNALAAPSTTPAANDTSTPLAHTGLLTLIKEAIA